MACSKAHVTFTLYLSLISALSVRGGSTPRPPGKRPGTCCWEGLAWQTVTKGGGWDRPRNVPSVRVAPFGYPIFITILISVRILWFSSGAWRSLLRNVHTGFRGKAAGTWCWLNLVPRLRISGAVPLRPRLRAWPAKTTLYFRIYSDQFCRV